MLLESVTWPQPFTTQVSPQASQPIPRIAPMICLLPLSRAPFCHLAILRFVHKLRILANHTHLTSAVPAAVFLATLSLCSCIAWVFLFCTASTSWVMHVGTGSGILQARHLSTALFKFMKIEFEAWLPLKAMPS